MSLKDEIVKWNNEWQFDYWYRQKYNIPIWSPEHLELNQIDIKMAYLESKLADEQLKRWEDNKKKEEEYKKNPNMWLKQRDVTVSDDVLKSIDWSKV